MTNEEKKAIEMLRERKKDLLESSKNRFYSSDRELYKEHVRAIDTLLNLIEKQSKEIEELKEDNKKYIDLHYVPYEQYTSKLNELNEKWKDKIKAILKKYGKKEIEYAPDFYKEIQSLLEEE